MYSHDLITPMPRDSRQTPGRQHASQLHTSPSSPDPRVRQRRITRIWPRPPTGVLLHPRTSLPGKQSANGLPLWGATLLDFFRVQRIPGPVGAGLSTVTTGSKMLRWVREVGLEEGTWEGARLAREWAAQEEESRVIRPWIFSEEVLLRQEGWIRQGRDGWGRSMPSEQRFMSLQDAYPAPWPLLPFSYPTENLQASIPLHHLPKRLIVHDPWGVLASGIGTSRTPATNGRQTSSHFAEAGVALMVQGSTPQDVEDWAEAEYTPHSYILSLSDAGKASMQSVDLPGSSETSPGLPEAHLYLSPGNTLGKGNHSFVYEGELELSRIYVTAQPPLPLTLSPHPTPRNDTGPSQAQGSHPPPTVKFRVTAKLSKPNDPHLAWEAACYERFVPHLGEWWSGYNVLPPLVKDPVPLGPVVPNFYGLWIPEDGSSCGAEEGETRMKDAAHLSPIMLLESCGHPVVINELTVDERTQAASLLLRFHHAGWVHGSVFVRNVLVQPGPLNVPPWERGAEKSFRLIDFGRSYQQQDKPRGREDRIAPELKGWEVDRRMEENDVERMFGLGVWDM